MFLHFVHCCPSSPPVRRSDSSGTPVTSFPCSLFPPPLVSHLEYLCLLPWNCVNKPSHLASLRQATVAHFSLSFHSCALVPILPFDDKPSYSAISCLSSLASSSPLPLHNSLAPLVTLSFRPLDFPTARSRTFGIAASFSLVPSLLPNSLLGYTSLAPFSQGWSCQYERTHYDSTVGQRYGYGSRLVAVQIDRFLRVGTQKLPTANHWGAIVSDHCELPQSCSVFESEIELTQLART